MKLSLVIAKMPVDGIECTVTELYENNEAAELYINRRDEASIAGNIYLGHVTKIGSGGIIVRYDGKNEGFLPYKRD